MSKKSDYYKQGISAYLNNITSCAYAPLSTKGLDWAAGYADAELANSEPEEFILPTLEDAKNAIIDECGGRTDWDECPE
jgi:hypothetical protein